MLDKQKHELILKNILRDIYSTPQLQGQLVFKGGTCLYLFYGLDRFSVDLDFNITAKYFNDQLVTDILKKYLAYLIDFIDKKVKPANILDGLGELLNEQQKDKVRNTLKRDILFDLRSYFGS